MTELIKTGTCLSILERYGIRDNAGDIKLVRYFITKNSIIVKILYQGIDLKCKIDKLAFIDNEIPNATSLQEFADVYLKPLGKKVIEIIGEEKPLLKG